MFDIRTITIGIMSLNLLLAIVMVIYWRTQKTYPGFGFWSLANIISALAYLLYGLRGMIPGIFSIVFATTFAALAYILRMEAVRYFYGKRKWLRSSIPFVLVFTGLFIYFTEVRDSAVIRNTILTISVIIYSIACIYLLIKLATPTQKIINYSIAFFLFIYCVIMITRVVVWWMNPTVRNLLAQTPVNIIFAYYEIVAHVGTTILFLMLNTQQFSSDLLITQKELENLATIDSLTKVNNRRMFFELGTLDFLRSVRLNHPFSLLTFDIDFFKEVNDTYGHAAGDMVLRNSLQIIKNSIRDIDVLGRTGGDEFAICFPETSLAGAMEAGRRIQLSLSASEFSWEGHPITVTLSIGIAELSKIDMNFDELIQRSDQLLYSAKRAGRNQIFTDRLNPILNEDAFVQIDGEMDTSQIPV